MVIIEYTVLDTEITDAYKPQLGERFLSLNTGYVSGGVWDKSLSTFISLCKKSIIMSSTHLRDPAITTKSPSIVLCTVGLQ